MESQRDVETNGLIAITGEEGEKTCLNHKENRKKESPKKNRWNLTN